MTHTPTPWAIERTGKEDDDDIHWSECDYRVIGANEAPVFIETSYYPMAPSYDDAAFIVRAVNSHDNLVEALQEVATGDWNNAEWVRGFARAALEGLE